MITKENRILAPETEALCIEQAYDSELEELEVALLFEGVYRRYGADFRHYAYASLRRRVWNMVRDERLPSISRLQELVLHDPAAMGRLLTHISVSVTSMFRDP